MFLHCIGPEALKVYNTFNLPDTSNLSDIIEKFHNHIIGETNITYERYKFNQRQQQKGESTDEYITALKILAATCDFCDCMKESLIRDKLVTGVLCSETRKKLLEQRHLTLQIASDLCKASEASASQLKHISTGDEEVNKIKMKPWKNHIKPKRQEESQAKTCKFCGGKHVFIKSKCPAYGKVCAKCKGKNHFSKACRTRTKEKVRHVEQSEEESENELSEWVNCVGLNKSIKCKMMLNQKPIAFLIDTGSTVNIIPSKIASNLVASSDTCLKSYCHTRIETVGSSVEKITNPKNNRTYKVNFIVVDGNTQPVIGFKTAKLLKLIEVKTHNFELVSSIQDSNVFNDDTIGTLPGEQHLVTNKSVTPVVMPDRRVPIAVKDRLKKELRKMEQNGVIKPVTEPTPWVSQLVVAPKLNGQLRICIDPRYLNKALQREHYTMPLLEDVLHELSGSKVFSKVDLKNGYWHVKLDDESSHLTTFQTCWGRYRYLRLPFGLNVSAEIFERKIREIFGDMKGVICLRDDIVIHGKSKEDHDKTFQKFLQKCEKYGVKLNKDKMEYAQTSISFMGHIISENGTETDPQKVSAITNMPTPKCIKDVRRFLGMTQYIARYIPNLTKMAIPLQNLLKKDTPFIWATTQEKAFTDIKNAIANSPKLAIFDNSKELSLENDASEYGLGSVLIQDGKPLAYASRTLSSTEQNYAQIEKELLAITFGLKKFHNFTFARPITVITDHKPLVSITKKPLCKASKRLQNMLMRNQEYNYEVIYKPGSKMLISDCLSRAPLNNPCDETEETISNIAMTPFNDKRIEELKIATSNDPILDQLKMIILKGWPDNKDEIPMCIRPYFNYRDELTIQDGIILRGERIIIPQSMQNDLKIRVHAGHQGINSCLRRARSLIYWPGMSTDIRNFVDNCNTCATYSFKQPEQPLQMHDVPDRPWQKIATDLFSIEGRTYMVTVDYYSQFIELDYLPETTSNTVITKLKHHMARYGICQTLISDNGPQYTSDEFKKFSQKWKFHHVKIAPGNSKANGLAEAAVKTIKNMMIKCRNSKDDQYLGLLNLRNTPNEGLTTSPVQRLMGRRTQSLTPATPSALKQSLIPVTEHSKMHLKRLKSAQPACKRKTLKQLEIGDSVRMEPISGQKEWRKAEVTKKLPFDNYEVFDGKRKFIRARKFLRHRPTTSDENDTATDSSDDVRHNAPSSHSTSTEFPMPIYSTPIEEPGRDGLSTWPEVELSRSPTTKQAKSQDSPVGTPSHRSDPQTQHHTPYKTRSGRVVVKPNKYTG